jgi:hypothetical protein
MRFPSKPVPTLMPFGSGCTYVPPNISYVGKTEDPPCKVETRGKSDILVGYYPLLEKLETKNFVSHLSVTS